MSFFKKIWNKVKGSESVLYPSFNIPDEKILDGSYTAKKFSANKNYFEIRVKEQFLKNMREYWNEYNPLTIVLTEFIYANRKESIPFVVGPELLKKIEQLDGNESVRYKNTRVVGPIPYRGDQVALFTGLFRLKTKDWALQTINLLESVANAFDSSKLTNYLNIATPLMEGIEGFFGMGDKVQFRIGQRYEYSDPATGSSETFSSGYWVMIRQDGNSLNRNNFWVKDGQLFYGSDKNNIQPYSSNDYLLYSIDQLNQRNDYTTFKFHERWRDVKNAIWSSNKDTATEAYQLLIANLRDSDDLIESQMNQLQTFYLAQFKREYEAWKRSQDPFSGLLSDNSVLGVDNQTFDNLNLATESRDALLTANNYLINTINTEPQTDINFMIDENYIARALNSPILNENAIINANTNNLAISASMMTLPDVV
ncbi:MAG: hypothetical protein AAF620_17910 [Bacteroidota bacterium]